MRSSVWLSSSELRRIVIRKFLFSRLTGLDCSIKIILTGITPLDAVLVQWIRRTCGMAWNGWGLGGCDDRVLLKNCCLNIDLEGSLSSFLLSSKLRIKFKTNVSSGLMIV